MPSLTRWNATMTILERKPRANTPANPAAWPIAPLTLFAIGVFIPYSFDAERISADLMSTVRGLGSPQQRAPVPAASTLRVSTQASKSEAVCRRPLQAARPGAGARDAAALRRAPSGHERTEAGALRHRRDTQHVGALSVGRDVGGWRHIARLRARRFTARDARANPP